MRTDGQDTIDRINQLDLFSRASRTEDDEHRHGEGVESLAGLPLMLTVVEAARVLRISRTTAYKLADLWRRSDGATGLPTVRLGSRVLVRRVDLAQIVGETD